MIELNQTTSILLYINIVLLGTFSMYLAYRYHSMSKVFIIVTICIFAIPAMFRYEVGIDYVQYIPVVNIIGNNSSLSRALMFTYKEPTLGVIFYFASSIFKNIRVGFSIYALATQILFILSCWKFNNQLLNVEYADLKELFKGNINEISVFDEQDRDELTNNVKTLRWDTSYKLFTEVFSANSKYMTTHQAKGLEWDKVIVSLTPTRRDNINISDVFSKPQLTEENSSDEFMRMYYVACSRAKEDLYIHIQSGCTKEVIVSNLNEYIRNTNCKLEYEFLPI